MGRSCLTTSYLINRMPTRILKYETPIITLKQCFLASHHLFSFLTPKVFGCTTFVHIMATIIASLILGHKNAFSLGITQYHPQSSKYFMSMDVSFFENQPYRTRILFRGRLEEKRIFWKYPKERSQGKKQEKLEEFLKIFQLKKKMKEDSQKIKKEKNEGREPENEEEKK